MTARAESPETEVTGLLQAWRRGDGSAEERLLGLVYHELQRIARRHLAREEPGQTLQTTALVHEAYLRLLGQRDVDWHDRAHFFALASTMMRRVLVDAARARLAGKRAHRETPLSMVTGLPATGGREIELLDLNRALDLLAREHRRAARIVEMRFFAGLENQEIAAVLELSERTVEREWSFARAWLRRELSREGA
ncbi:MAG TPA: sigma-70 family RNA polymerase sigma factor [Thermoanaerobaculia bacterium]|jgi:RNA polymerase sigma factor (TIGR02999 family)|nr:sigma-70 family RNA polymerase sigma factor [Thermoanaerobaculia bacterium]